MGPEARLGDFLRSIDVHVEIASAGVIILLSKNTRLRSHFDASTPKPNHP